MVQRHVEDHPDAPAVEVLHQAPEELLRGLGVSRNGHGIADPVIVEDVVAMRGPGREDRAQPDRVDAQVLEMPGMLQDPLEIAPRVVGVLPAADLAYTRRCFN